MSRPSRVAIVDDDQAIREALEDLMQSCGYESVLFASAEDYLAYRHKSGIDCMLLDVKMPGLSGLQLQSVLNDLAEKPPIIFMTSYQDDKTRTAAMDGGALAVFGKPTNFDQLLDCIQFALA